MKRSLIEELRDAGFEFLASPLFDRAADRLEKLERVLEAAKDFRRSQTFPKMDALNDAIAEAEAE